MLVKRTFLFAALVPLSLAMPAMAAPKRHEGPSVAKAACVGAHEDGQTLRAQKRLRDAREKFVACAKSECPAVLRKECGEQIEQIEAVTPSLVFEAHDEKGNADAAVKVSLDGKVVAERLTGTSIEVEPGEHSIQFERADGKIIEQKILVAEGEKNRKIVAEYAAPAAPKDDHPLPPPAEKKVPLLSYVAGGVAVVGLGSFAVFALSGKSKEDDLAGKCSPNCSDDEVGSVNRSYLIADVSLGVAAVATIVAVVLALPALGGSSSASVKTAQTPAPWFPKVKTVTP